MNEPKSIKDTNGEVELLFLLKHLERKRISDSCQIKLLRIYVGLYEFMNDSGAYPREIFNEIRKKLKFSSLKELIEAVHQSGIFEFAFDKEHKIQAIISDFAIAKREEIRTKYPRTEVPKQTILFGKETMDIISLELDSYKASQKSDRFSDQMDYTKVETKVETEGETKEISNNLKKSLERKNKTDKIKVTEENIAIAKKFFHELNLNDADRYKSLLKILSDFERKENLTHEEAKETLVELIQGSVEPYFASRSRFLTLTYENRLSWFIQLMKSPLGIHMKSQALAKFKEIKAQRVVQKRLLTREKQRSNKPVSAYEWTDPESGVRFYSDPDEDEVRIPQEAPPRPTGTAVWNVLARTWDEP